MDRVEDLVIDACKWHVDSEGTQYKDRALGHFCDQYIVLLDFLRSEGLLRDPTFGQGVSDWMNFEFRKSHLTDEGFALVKLCHGSWNPSFGQGHTKRHLVQWRRKLEALRSNGE